MADTITFDSGVIIDGTTLVHPLVSIEGFIPADSMASEPFPAHASIADCGHTGPVLSGKCGRLYGVSVFFFFKNPVKSLDMGLFLPEVGFLGTYLLNGKHQELRQKKETRDSVHWIGPTEIGFYRYRYSGSPVDTVVFTVANDLGGSSYDPRDAAVFYVDNIVIQE